MMTDYFRFESDFMTLQINICCNIFHGTMVLISIQISDFLLINSPTVYTLYSPFKCMYWCFQLAE